MESDIAQKAVDAFMEQVPEDGEASIIFFGGEPLNVVRTLTMKY